MYNLAREDIADFPASRILPMNRFSSYLIIVLLVAGLSSLQAHAGGFHASDAISMSDATSLTFERDVELLPRIERLREGSRAGLYLAACCKVCRKGKACGDSCISRSYSCHKGPGCACDG